MRTAANRRDASLRAAWQKTQDALIMANTAAEEHAAELAQGPEAAIGDDPLAVMEGETHGTDADAGEYLQQSDEAPVEAESEGE
jgi:DNA-directed RNA polymerase subunit beta'